MVLFDDMLVSLPIRWHAHFNTFRDRLDVSPHFFSLACCTLTSMLLCLNKSYLAATNPLCQDSNTCTWYTYAVLFTGPSACSELINNCVIIRSTSWVTGHTRQFSRLLTRMAYFHLYSGPSSPSLLTSAVFDVASVSNLNMSTQRLLAEVHFLSVSICPKW